MSEAVVEDDLSALAWVHGELRRSLEAAHKALRRYLKESEAIGKSDVDVVDPAVLRTARTQLHQGVGALELVGLPAVADMLRASEAAVQRMVARPAMVDAAAVETIEKASFALLDFLGRQLAGKPVSPLLLFPQYLAVQQLAGADRVHPADLWKIDWQWRELPPDATATPRQAGDEARSAMETLVLALMRQGAGDGLRMAQARMSDLCADLGAGARQTSFGGTHLATFWQLAAAVFEAQAGGLLEADVYAKRLASRLLAQLRMRAKGHAEISDRLAQDLLFFCAHAQPPTDDRPAPRLAAVRTAWRLDGEPTGSYETARLGRFDPALLALARKRVAAAKDSWSAVAGGEMHRMVGLADQFTLVGESLQRVFPSGDVLATALQTAVTQTVATAAAPPPTLAMEVATAVLYLDASLEDGEFDHPELAARVQALARRIDDVRIGAEPLPLDNWMEELYRRVSDRQTMGSVVQELRASLSEIEKQIDQYFRDPTQRQLLIPVPAQLSAMRGVLSVLGMDQASAAALHMRDDVDALAQTEVDPQRAIQTGTFDRLADNLGALSFLIDMLSVQPVLAKSLFRFDPETGSLSAVMGQSERISAFAAFDDAPPAPAAPAQAAQVPLLEQLRALAGQAGQPEVGDDVIARQLEPLAQQALAAGQPELAHLLASAQQALRGGADVEGRREVRLQLVQAVAGLAPPAAPEMPPPAPLPAERTAVAGGTGLEDDAEMRDIFIEEAREVITEARAALERLADAPDSAGDMTAVRRAFHTLKGSSRMLGLRDFGDAAWACEQLYNARLASAPRMDNPLRSFSADALGYLADWTEAIAAGRLGGHSAADVAHAADALRLEGHRLPIAAPAGAAAAVPAAPELGGEPITLALADASAQARAEAVAAAPAPVAPSFALELAEDDMASAEAPTTEAGVHAIEAALPAAAAAPEEISDAEAEAALALFLDTVVTDDDAVQEVPAPVPEPAELLDFDFEVASDTEGASPEAASEAQPLTARVPDLPSAADLDLGAPAPVPAPEVAFDFDLAAFDEGAPAAAGAQPGLPPDTPAPATPTVADAESLEIDLAELEGIFATAPMPVRNEPPQPDFLIDPGVPEVVVEAVPAPLAEPLAAPVFEPVPEPVLEPLPEIVEVALPPTAAEAAAAAEDAAEEAAEDEQVKVIGPLRIGIPLFNIYLNEADELSRRLSTELAEWALEDQRHPVPESSVALAHSLAGSSATVGYSELSALARALEHALMRSHADGPGRPGEAQLFNDVAEEIRRLLHQFAAGFLRSVAPGLTERLAAHERQPAAAPAPEAALPEAAAAAVPEEIDAELFPIFEQEAEELLPQLQTRLRHWLDDPEDSEAPTASMRSLHTLKGGARLAGAMRLGEMAHELETQVEALAQRGGVQGGEVEALLARADAMSLALEQLRTRATAAPSLPPAAVPPAPPLALAPAPATEQASVPATEPVATPGPVAELLPEPVAPWAAPEPAAAQLESEAAAVAQTSALSPAAAPVAEPAAAAPPPTAPPPPVEIDWHRFAGAEIAPQAAAERPGAAAAVVRVRAGLLDRLVNHAGEVSITRARIDGDVRQMQGALGDLTDSLERLRRQLRDIELQAETQISTRIEAAKAASQAFDPLEMDRFTRFQELTRFMAESVNDVATLQRGLQRRLQSTEDELAAQARLTRELQDDLLRTRMVEFESLSERLYRTARQAAKDTGKQVRLEIVGGGIEIDRGVLERMAGSFEHLLRNSVAHGVEAPAARAAAGKDASGLITVTVAQAGNEVGVEFADDGGGLDLPRIRQRAVERGLLAEGAPASDAELAQFIFHPGFSTAEAVTELAGRGVGLDVVRAEVNAMGGRVETASETGRGTRFKLLMPLTTAVTQVVMLRCGELQVAVPSTLIEIVRRAPRADVERAYAEGHFEYAGAAMPFYWLPALLREGTRGEIEGRTQTVVVIRSAAQRVAVHVDEVVGNQEVVVKNVGPQLARLPGLAGVTLLPSGAVALIYNPVALASLYGDEARQRMSQVSEPAHPLAAEAEPARAPMVLVVDDSLTVRRVTQRLLVREGYRVVLAKDGLEALARLAEERPVVLLSDIEMPRMDGFDLVRNVRADPALAGLPVVMITSRIAQKHRDYAAELGVDHYLGKPYAEEELLALVARYAGADIPS